MRGRLGRDPESEAGRLFGKFKASIKNIAKSRREMSGPKPTEVDRVTNWSDCEWEVEWQEEYGEKHEDQENQSLSSEHEIYLIGKGGKKGWAKGGRDHKPPQHIQDKRLPEHITGCIETENE